MLTVSHLLGTLQEDPYDASAIQGLRDAFTSGEPERLGPDAQRLLRLARDQHLARREFEAAASLLSIEIDVSSDPDQRAALLAKLGEIHREELLDDEAAATAYRAALELRPGDAQLAEAVEQIASQQQNWKEIAKRFVDEAETTSEASLKTSLLVRAAGFVHKHKKRGRDKDVDRLFRQALEADPGDARASRLFAMVLRQREKWDELAAVLLDAAEKTRSRDDRLQFYLAGARVLARQLQQPERAAACYERVLDFAPGHEEAMRFLVEHFTAKERWDHLASLYEDTLRARQKLENEPGILLQLAMVHWRFRNAPDAAEPFFARLRKMDPAHPAMLGFYRDHLGAAGDHQRLASILTDAQRATSDPKQKAALSVELAKVAAAGGATDRAIEAWKAVQRADPTNVEALAALKDLYLKGQKWNALVEVLKAEADALGPDQAERKIAVLREAIPIYRDQLRLDVMVVNAWNAILALQPDDREALDALAATYEQLGRWNDLIQALTRRAEASSDPTEQTALHMRVARLWIDRFANFNQATRPLEQVLERDPKNREAIGLLKDIYNKKRAYKQLFDVMKIEAELASDPDARQAHRIELARIAGDRLHRGADAIPLWKDVLAADPANVEAVDALEKLAEREKDWPTVAEVIERRLTAAPDDKERVRLLTKLGTLYSEQVGDATRAGEAWRRILAIDPKNGRALRTLREGCVAAGDWDGLTRLYADIGEWDALAEVLGNLADRIEDVALKVALSYRAADVYETQLREPQRAFRSYERVLAARPTDERALRALLAIYEREEKWTRLAPVYEGLFGILPEGAGERGELAEKLRLLSLERLHDADGAMRWAVAGYQLAPGSDAAVRALEASADKTGQWARVEAAYIARLEASSGAERASLRRSIARIADTKLGAGDRAVAQLRALLEERPSDQEAARELDRVLRRESKHGDLRGLYRHRIEHASDEAERWMLVSELAKLEEEQLGDKDAAAALYRRAVEIDPTDRGALAALDRLAVEAGRDAELASVLERRRELSENEAERVELMLRYAELQGDRLRDFDAAEASYRAVLDLRPTEPRAVSGLERLAGAGGRQATLIGIRLEPAYEAMGQWKKLEESLRRRLAHAEDKGEKRELRVRIAELAAGRNGDPAGAYQVLENAFLDDPADASLWDALSAHGEAAGKHADLAAALATAIDAGGLSVDDQWALSKRVARIHDVLLGKPEDAEPFHKKVLATRPDDDESFLALKELYTNAERWSELQALYRVRIAQTADAETKLELLLQVCFLFEELTDDPAQAIAAYQEVLELDPRHISSRRALDRLYIRTGKHRELAELLVGDLDIGSQGNGPSDLEAATIHARLGGLHEIQLAEPARALEHYEKTLELDPASDVAREGLERLLHVAEARLAAARVLARTYEGRGDEVALARVLEVELEFETDPGGRVALLGRIAGLHEGRGDVASAFSARMRAFEADPADPALRSELASAAIRAGAERQQAAALERTLRTLRGQPAEVEVLRDLALLFDGPLDDAGQAEATWARLFDVAEGDAERRLEAARALERLHLASGSRDKLAGDLRAQASLVDEPGEKQRLLARLAALLEELGRSDDAVLTHLERLDQDPADVDALRALERLHEQRGEWKELIGILEKLDQAASSDDERRPIARRIAAIYETELEDSDRAISQYNDVTARFGPDRETLSALVRLYDAADRATELLDVVLMIRDLAPDGAPRVGLTFHAAELMRTRTKEVERAIETYAQVLESDPSHEGAFESLLAVMVDAGEPALRWLAARTLRPRFEALGDYARLFRVLDVIATSDDPVERLDALRRAVTIAEGPLGDFSAAFDRASRALEAGATEPDAAQLVDDVERLAAASGRWADLARVLEKAAPEIADGELSAETHRKIAEIARTRLGDKERARLFYNKVVEARPDHGGALDALEALAIEDERPSELREVLRKKTEVASDDERPQLLLRQAEVSETQLADADAAIDLLDRVLAEPALRPQQSERAFLGLERLYQKTERWSDLASTYERMLDGAVGSRVEAHHKLGRLYVERLGDASMALEQFKAALASGGSHEGTIAALEAILAGEDVGLAAEAASILEPTYLSRMAWAKVVAALEARVRGATDLDERKALLVRLAQMHEEYLEDLEGAVGIYARLFREDPRDSTTWDTLGRLGRALQKWDRIAEVYRTTLDEIGVEDEASARLAVLAAQIHEERLQDRVAAAKLYRKALAYAPSDASVFGRLEAILVAGRAWTELLALYREQAELVDADALRIELYEKAARIEREELGQPDQAIDLYRRILDFDPSHIAAIAALDALYAQRERWADLAEHLRQQAAHASGAAEIELRHRLGVLLADRLGDKEAAIDTFEEITRSHPSHGPTIAALERLVTDPVHQARIIDLLDPIYLATDQWKKRVAIAEARLGLLDASGADASEKVGVLEGIAHLHEDRGRDRGLAFEAWARALTLEPGSDVVRGEVERLAALTGDWNALIAAYEKAVGASEDPIVQGTLLNAAARVHDEKRGDPRAAIETYERLLVLDPSDASPLDALEALHTMVGDWNGMVSVLERKVERSYDPAERGELLRRAGSVAEDLLGDRARAVSIYQRAVREDETDTIALESLDRLHSEASEHAALADVLKRRVELEQDPSVRVDCALRLGRVAEEYLRDADLAIDAFQRALGDQDGEPTAVQALGRLYERQARWPELLDNLRLRAGAATGDTERTQLLFRASEVLERELDDVPEALLALEQILAIAPGHEPSIQALVRIARLEEHRAQAAGIVVPLLEQQNRSHELAQVLELVADSASDAIEKRDVLRRLAAVHEAGRRDLPAAFEALRRALVEDASDVGLVDELERVGASMGTWERTCDVFTARAGSASDPETARMLYARAASIAESRLGDDARAIDAHRRALEQMPDDEAALEALDRLYAKQGAHQELAEILDRRVHGESEPTLRNELLLRLGTLRWEHFEDTRGAFAAFQEVLERDPSEPRAVGAMEGLLAADENLASEAVVVLDNAYRATGAVQKVAGLYGVRVKLADNDGERIRLYGELAALREGELGDLGGALDAWIAAFALDPRDLAALDEIERLAGATGGWERLRGLLEKAAADEDLDRESRRDLSLRAAGWYRDRLGDAAAAEAGLRSALAADRECDAAHEQLAELLRAPGREAELVAALTAWADVELDEERKKGRLREAAVLAEEALGDAAGAAVLLRKILETDGSDASALDELIRIDLARGRHADVASLLERRIDVESDPDARVAFRRQLAELLVGPLAGAGAAASDRAIEAWQAVLDEAPTDFGAMDALERLYDAAKRFGDLEELVQRRLDVAETDAERIAGRVRLARLVDRLGRRGEAIDQLQEILAGDPDNADASQELAELLRKDARWAELGALLDRRVASAQRAGDQAALRATWLALAALREEQLSDLPGARAALGEALAIAEDAATLDRGAALAEKAGDLEATVTLRERRVGQLTGAEAVAEASRVAELAESKLRDIPRAERALQAAWDLDRGAEAAKQRLITFYEKHARHAPLAQVLRGDAEAASDKAVKVPLLRRVADLYAKELGDPASAAALLEQAAQLEPEDRSILLPLCDLYIAASRQADAIPVLQKIIASYGTKRTKEVAVYQHRLGLALEGLGDVPGALGAFDAAFKIDLTNVAILRDLGRLCWRTGDFDRAQKTFRALLLQKLDASSGITKGDIYYYLGDIAAKQGDPKKAVQNLERALVEQPGHPEAGPLLGQLKG